MNEFKLFNNVRSTFFIGLGGAGMEVLLQSWHRWIALFMKTMT
jgi:hypothetical protein